MHGRPSVIGPILEFISEGKLHLVSGYALVSGLPLIPSKL